MLAFGGVEGGDGGPGDDAGGEDVALKDVRIVVDGEPHLVVVSHPVAGDGLVGVGQLRSRGGVGLSLHGGEFAPAARTRDTSQQLEPHGIATHWHTGVFPIEHHLVFHLHVLLQVVDVHGRMGVDDTRLHVPKHLYDVVRGTFKFLVGDDARSGP